MGVVWGGGVVIFFLHFMLFPTSLERIILGIKNKIIFTFRKTMVDRDNGNLYPIYIEKQQLWC